MFQDNATYYYVDVWSSTYTWGGLDPPIECDFVVVPEGQTLLLDTSTPILKMLLIQGRECCFQQNTLDHYNDTFDMCLDRTSITCHDIEITE